MLAFAGWVVLRLAEAQSAATERSGVERARAAAVAIDRKLSSMATTITVLGQSRTLREGDFAGFHRLASDVLDNTDIGPQGIHIVLTDAEGEQILNTRRPFGQRVIQTAALDSVRRTLASGHVQVSGVFQGAESRQTEVAVLVPLPDRDGGPPRVLSMSVPTTALGATLGNLDLPSGWVAALWDQTGSYVARTDAPTAVGTAVPMAIRDATSRAGNGTILVNEHDGRPVFYAIARSELAGWTVAVGVPRSVLTEPMRISLELVLSGGTVLLLLSLAAALALGRRIAGPVHGLAGSAVALGHGGSAAAMVAIRSPFREVNAVAGALADAAQRLRDSEAQQRLAVDAVGLGVWRFDAHTGLVHGSDRAALLLGMPASVPTTEGASLEAWIRNVAAEHRTAIRNTLYRDGPAQGEFETEFPVGSPDGQVRWLVMRGAFLTDAESDGQPAALRAVGILEDVTERRRAHDELVGELVGRHATDRRLFAAIIENSADMIVAVDQGLRLILFNTAYQTSIEALYGHKPVIGELLTDKFSPLSEGHTKAIHYWGRALAGERFTAFETIGDPSRPRRRYELSFGTILDSDGRRIGAFEIARDMSERDRTEQALRQAEESLNQARKMEAIGQLTGGIAHDFNNLLQAIGSALYLIEPTADRLSDGRMSAALDMATKAVERGATLTQHLLAFSRRQRLEPRPVDVGALVEGMGGLMDRTLGGTIRIETAADPDLWPALVDANQLEMALLNLAINARDAMPNGGTLVIRSENRPDGGSDRPADLPSGDFVRISVVDSGSGMSEEVAARAFEPFFTTKGVGHGTGLGLSMVHGLAAQSGGMATITSQVGAGTTVTLYLPRVDATASPDQSAEPPSTPSPHHAATLLVVEDEPLVRMAAVSVLEQAGFQVLEASNGPHALEVLSHETVVDLLLTDYAMPGMTGLELIQDVRLRHPDLPVLLVTGYAELPKPVAMAGLTILQKPYRADDLVARIRGLLAPPPEPPHI